MKNLLAFSFFMMAGLVSNAQDKTDSLPTRVVESSCGQCNFKLKAPGCTLAVKIDGKAYFVEGTDINDHGDAHAENGFCNAVRKAEVKGRLVNDKFVVRYFRLIEEKKN